jgi:DNA-binding GntR family transcriptional regulator
MTPIMDDLPRVDDSRPGRVSTVDMVVDRLRQAISNGELRGGQRLIEADLTESYKVSRGPVREAMRRLAAEGLIEMHHHRGARVRQLSRHEVYALFQVREMLEGLSARLAAMNTAAAESRKELAELGVAMNAAAEAGEVGTYIPLNNRFHNLVVGMSDNPLLPQMLGHLHTQAMRYQFRQLIGLDSTLDSNREHQRIITAILDGDADYAERTMRQHIQRSRDMTVILPEDMFAAGD